jgi:hypothetical protein
MRRTADGRNRLGSRLGGGARLATLGGMAERLSVDEAAELVDVSVAPVAVLINAGDASAINARDDQRLDRSKCFRTG